jgi:hypothetical protein
LENSLLGDKAPGLRGVEKPVVKSKLNAEVSANLNVNNQEGRKRLTALLEKVEGCAVSVLIFLESILNRNNSLYYFYSVECCGISYSDFDS